MKDIAWKIFEFTYDVYAILMAVMITVILGAALVALVAPSVFLNTP